MVLRPRQWRRRRSLRTALAASYCGSDVPAYRVRGAWLQLQVALLLLVALIFSTLSPSKGEGSEAAAATLRPRQVQSLLKRLNKPPLATIQSPDGDIIDCVHIFRQPAFDHPLLKNHTIQMRPSIQPSGMYGEAARPFTQTWNQNGEKCPDNTIPIRRTKEEDVMRATSVATFGKKTHGSRHSSLAGPAEGHHYGVAYATGDANYYGTKVTINVFPALYGDEKTRLFIYWTRDAYDRTGCYNLACSGFIQTNPQVVIGGSISPVSIYGGPQYEYDYLVWKDPAGGNWWLQVGGNSVGYWPSSIFTRLQTGVADSVQWGGEVFSPQNTSPMGSGHFPKEGLGKATYSRVIQVVDSSNNLRQPNGVGLIAQSPNCYNVSLLSRATNVGRRRASSSGETRHHRDSSGETPQALPPYQARTSSRRGRRPCLQSLQVALLLLKQKQLRLLCGVGRCGASSSASTSLLSQPFSLDGDIIDCVHISRQPAFDHPLLKNHTIQIRPSIQPSVMYGEAARPFTQTWNQNGEKCPDNTIPIRRIKEEDVIRATSVAMFGKKTHGSHHPRLAGATDGHQYGVASATGDTNYYGTKVFPTIYGDEKTRLFIYWTVVIGGSISPVSIYGGPQYEYDYLVWKDPAGGNWWLQVGGNSVGYWPSSIFTHLQTGVADSVQWGGEVNSPRNTTPMGSGHFPEEGFGKAAYSRAIQVVDSSNNLKPPNGVGLIAHSPNCYNVMNGSTVTNWGTYIYYGGPGCP
uniref:Neprosin PEP catalytic domain-containing protein n=1 Tax=Oryza barthii TaxID=65489 RepID=A0A0D3EZ89_9ORYZ